VLVEGVKISIALATYNGERFLAAQLDSFLKQSRPPDEVVIYDDRSTDETYEIIRSFAESASFKVIYERNDTRLGALGNFDRALQRTTGDLVFLSDQDDIWYADKIRTIMELQERYPEKLLYMNDAAITDSELRETGLTKLGQLQSAGYPASAFVQGCCCAVRRDLLQLCLPVAPSAKGHDNWVVDFSNGLGATYVLREVLQLYRRHESNTSTVLANRVRPISPWQRIMYQLERATSAEADVTALAEIECTESMLETVKQAQVQCDRLYDEKLLRFASELGKDLASLQYRYELRSRKLFPRLFGSFRYWLTGGYSRAAGVKSLVRDIIG
jgi:glycosyltransferase involved in cell wall biosynthesis